MSLVNHQIIFAKNVVELINYIFSKNYAVTLGEAFRTLEQAKLYAQRGKGVANSLHCKRLAIDLNLFSIKDDTYTYLTKSEDYEEFGKYWEMLHKKNRWGGRFKIGDGNHFQMLD